VNAPVGWRYAGGATEDETINREMRAIDRAIRDARLARNWKTWLRYFEDDLSYYMQEMRGGR
jgi:hypothetical protein